MFYYTLTVVICPFCTGSRVSQTNSLVDTYPELAVEWDFEHNHPQTPDQVTYGTTTPVWWKCRFGKDHIFQASVNRRTDLNQRENSYLL